MTSNFTDSEWANIKRMLNGMLENKTLAVEILRNGLGDNEADIYKAYFLLTEHRIQSPTEGMKKVECVNYYWTLTEYLKQRILKMRPWLDANGERIEDPEIPHRVTERAIGRSPSSGHLYIPQARPAGKKPVRPALPATQGKSPKKVLGPIDPKATTGQHNKRAVRS